MSARPQIYIRVFNSWNKYKNLYELSVIKITFPQQQKEIAAILFLLRSNI